MTYFEHLKANWKVAFHSFNDFLEHFIHGLLPCIKWEHKQPDVSIHQILDIMNTELNCIRRNIKGCNRDCLNCDLLKPDTEIIAVYEYIIKYFENI